MNQKQREYAIGRVNKIVEARSRAISEKFSKETRLLSDKEKADLLRTGAVKLRDDVNEICNYTDVVRAFDFAPFEDREKHLPGYEEALAALQAEGRRVTDQIMLGDSEAAVALLTAFEQG